MAKPEKKARERRRSSSSSSYFLRCFGISRKIHSDKTYVDDNTSQETKKTKTKTRTRWFSRLKNNGEITTKPSYEKEKQNLIVEDDDVKKQTMCRVIRHVSDLEDIANVEDNTKEKDTDEERDINPDPLSLSGNDTCHEQETNILRGGKLDRAKTIGSEPKLKEKSTRVRKGSRVDPVIGITIVMLTLMIMLIWGRLCAILCASTWCYFLPRLNEVATTAKRKRGFDDKAEREQRSSDLDLNSEAYKKKVVLDGFLFRQHRVSL